MGVKILSFSNLCIDSFYRRVFKISLLQKFKGMLVKKKYQLLTFVTKPDQRRDLIVKTAKINIKIKRAHYKQTHIKKSK